MQSMKEKKKKRDCLTTRPEHDVLRLDGVCVSASVRVARLTEQKNKKGAKPVFVRTRAQFIKKLCTRYVHSYVDVMYTS